MSISLPKAISDCFSIDNTDTDAVAQYFSDTAVVKDEGHTYNGLVEIKLWKYSVANKYKYTSVPFSSDNIDGNIVVMSHLVGNFPGSPIDLRYVFSLEGGKITSLEITP
jgi:hypothetical protein